MEKFILEVSSYKYLEFHNTFITLKLVLWGLYAGILIAIAMSFYRKFYLGTLVRALLKKEALTEESAVTLKETNVKCGPLMRQALKNGGTLRRHIEITGGISHRDIPSKKKKVRSFFGMEETPMNYDFDSMKLYIPEERKFKADIIFERGNLSPFSFIILAIILTGAVIGVNIIIPELLTMLDNFLDIILG